MPYRRILLCVDSSSLSDHAVGCTGAIARALGSTVVASHVYAARLHDRRFRDLEPGLPEKHQKADRLEATRSTHDTLITRGLRMISDSYLEAAAIKLENVTVERKSIEGKNYVELVEEAGHGYDLAVLGARGLGLAAVNGNLAVGALGSVCERFIRQATTDVLVVKDSGPIDGPILVGVDGSPLSYGALRKALKLAAALKTRVETSACFDPDYHRVAFKAIAEVLSEQHARRFRFHEQQELHDDVINHGLENLYRTYLDNASIIARARGQEIETRLLTGKPAYALASRARETAAALVVVARFGLHRTDELDIGSTAETVVRLAPSSVLIVTESDQGVPLVWTREAQERLNRVPTFLRPIVKRAIETHARGRGLTEVTCKVVMSAKTSHGVFMPGHGRREDG